MNLLSLLLLIYGGGGGGVALKRGHCSVPARCAEFQTRSGLRLHYIAEINPQQIVTWAAL